MPDFRDFLPPPPWKGPPVPRRILSDGWWERAFLEAAQYVYLNDPLVKAPQSELGLGSPSFEKFLSYMKASESNKKLIGGYYWLAIEKPMSNSMINDVLDAARQGALDYLEFSLGREKFQKAPELVVWEDILQPLGVRNMSDLEDPKYREDVLSRAPLYVEILVAFYLYRYRNIGHGSPRVDKVIAIDGYASLVHVRGSAIVVEEDSLSPKMMERMVNILAGVQDIQGGWYPEESS